MTVTSWIVGDSEVGRPPAVRWSQLTVCSSFIHNRAASANWYELNSSGPFLDSMYTRRRKP